MRISGLGWMSIMGERLPVSGSTMGMYCVGFGGPSRECAQLCVGSFREQMPGIPIAFGGVEPLGSEDLFIELPDLDIGGRQGKLAVYDRAPKEWKYILYLDADVEVVGDISFLYWLLVDGWDVVICKDMAKYHTAWMMIRPDNKAEYDATIRSIGTGEVFQYNGGVFAFRRNTRTKRLFERWIDEWHRYGGRDQGALLRALHSDPVKLYVLFNQWNASDRYPMPVGEVAVIHHNQRARRWAGLIFGRTDSRQAWDAVDLWKKQPR